MQNTIELLYILFGIGISHGLLDVKSSFYGFQYASVLGGIKK
jgi:hypothetical protein